MVPERGLPRRPACSLALVAVATEVSAKEFKVLLSELNEQTGVIDGQRKNIQGVLDDIRGAFTEVEAHWNSPAGESFRDIAVEFNKDAEDLNDFLQDIVNRMRHTYNQYHTTESTAVRAVDAQNDSLNSPDNKGGGSTATHENKGAGPNLSRTLRRDEATAVPLEPLVRKLRDVTS